MDRTKKLYVITVGILVSCILLVIALFLIWPRLGLGPGNAGEPSGTAGPTTNRSPVPTYTPTTGPTAPPTLAEEGMSYRLGGSPLGGPSCDWTGFFGTVRDLSGQPKPGVQIGIWDESGKLLPVSISGADGRYEHQVSNRPVVGTWVLRVLVEGKPASPPYGFQSDDDCRSGRQRFQIDWEQTRQ